MNDEKICELNMDQLDAVAGGSIFGKPGGPGPGTGPYAPTGPIVVDLPTGPAPIHL
jgi:hypothetical protein